MILTVTLNAALDVTYHLDRIEWGHVNRIRRVSRRAGGKGINVARILQALGVESIVTGFAGGVTGDAIRGDLIVSRLMDRLVPIDGESRRTTAVEEPGGVTLFNEPGPDVSSQEWATFLRSFAASVERSDAVVLSGSLPRGLPADAYAVLASAAQKAGVPVLLDTGGEALMAGLAGRPAIAKPNVGELETALGRACPSVPDVVSGARELREGGAEAVVVTRGAEGMVAVTPDHTWLGTSPQRVSGNSTGAGDAAAAALALGMVDGLPWPDRLASAVALGAAAVRGPLAGDVDLDLYRVLHPAVVIEKL